MSKTKVICITNQKGGVGKTTTTANLAYALANIGKDVLVIDYDSQASLTNYLNVGLEENEEYYGIYEMMLCNLRKIDPSIDEVLGNIDVSTDEGFAELCKLCITRPKYLNREKVFDEENERYKVVDVAREFGFDLMPSCIELADYELEITKPYDYRKLNVGMQLYQVVRRIIKYHEYDYIFIDTNPSLGVMTMNAICAATDGIVIPTNLDIMSTRGVSNLVEKISDIQKILLEKDIVHMGVIGILLNLYSEKRTVDKIVEDNLDRFYPFKLFVARIPESVDAKRAVLGGLLFSQIHNKAKTQYDKLAIELEKTICEMENKGQVIQYLGQKPESEEEQ